jgi:hypothetical protein
MSSVAQIQAESKQGAILTVGFVLGGDRMAIVEPWVLDAASPDLNTLCKDLHDSWVAAQLPLITACYSADCYLAFIQAEGMMDGRVPYREDFLPSVWPGTLAAVTLPANCTGMGTYYLDSRDFISPRKRMATAKTFFPALPESLVTGNLIDPTVVSNYQSYIDSAQNGIGSILYGSQKWWRVLAAPKPRNTSANCPRSTGQIARGYVCTQRRRMTPR